MTLIQSWIDSLALLKPKNAQLFAMVTIKAILEAYKIMFVYWSWVIALMVGCYILPFIVPALTPVAHVSRGIGSDVLWVSSFLYEILFVAVCLSTRPSIAKKDWHYFAAQLSKFVIYLLFFSFTSLSSDVSSFSVFWVLFIADSTGGLKNLFLSFWYALKMVVFNYPLLVVLGLIFYVPVWLVHNTFYITPMMKNILAALFLPIGVCTYANIYIKKLHDQFDLYFKPVQ